MKTVFHLNEADSSKQSELLANIENLFQDSRIENPDIQVVLNSNGVKMALKDSDAQEFVEEFIEREVVFNICSNSIENSDIREEQLIERVKTVESGIGTLNILEDKGYNYVKI